MAEIGRTAFLQEMERHLDAAYNFARWLTEGSDEAEDIVHDALGRAINSWESFTPGTKMKSWLFIIVRRTYLNRLRRGKYEVTSSGFPESEAHLPAGPKEQEVERLPPGLVRRDLDAALKALPEDHRAIVLLADVEGASLQEIAEIMETPVGTVKSRLWRVRRQLREKLADYRSHGK